VHPEFMEAHHGAHVSAVHDALADAGYQFGTHLATDHEQHWWWKP
jgi:hypothetical protein